MKKTLICILLLLAAMSANAQFIVIDVRINYSYDDAGNRKERVNKIKTGIDPKASAEEKAVTTLSDLIAKQSIVIYPNPTKGMLTVEIKDYSDQIQAEFRLTDMSGRTISSKKATSGYQTFDLSRQAAGIYLLQVRINGESVVWKIIKE